MNPENGNYKNHKSNALGQIVDDNNNVILIKGKPLLDGPTADKGGSPEQAYVKADGSVGFLSKEGKRLGARRGERATTRKISSVKLLSRPEMPAKIASGDDDAKNGFRKNFFMKSVLPVLGLAKINFGGSPERTEVVALTDEEIQLEIQKRYGDKPALAKVVAFVNDKKNTTKTVTHPAVPAQQITLADLAEKSGGVLELTPAQINEMLFDFGSLVKDGLTLADENKNEE